jgi:hypothetical protein
MNKHAIAFSALFDIILHITYYHTYTNISNFVEGLVI